MMFWYIGGMLAGFAVGYIVATYQNRNRTGYKKGINDCRNCKHMKFVNWNGLIECEYRVLRLVDMPKACSKYKKIEESEDEGRGECR